MQRQAASIFLCCNFNFHICISSRDFDRFRYIHRIGILFLQFIYLLPAFSIDFSKNDVII